jgi:uncharacterized protein YfaS (alpha-2-macroglobulin family)
MGLQRLYTFQHDDGGWGWWTNDETNPRMTAYVVYGLHVARKSGYLVDPGVLASGTEALREMYEDSSPKSANRPYLFWVASLVDLEVKPPAEPKGIVAIAQVAHGHALRGEMGPAKKLAAKLAADLEKWQGVRTIATCLRALLHADPGHKAVPQAVSRLLKERTGSYWRNTIDTAHAVLALLDYISIRGLGEEAGSIRVAIDGRERLVRQVRPRSVEGFPAEISIPGEELKGGTVSIRIAPKGKLSVAWSAALSYVETSEHFRPRRSPIVLTRRYFRPGKRGDPWDEEEVEMWSRIKVGEVIVVKLTVRAPQEIPTVLLEDALPAGFEVFGDGKDDDMGWELPCEYASLAIRDDRVTIALEEVGRDPYEIYYPIRAAFPGDYRALPARAFNMYDERQAGRSGEFGIEVGR